MKRALPIALLIASSALSAHATDFPFLQDGGARDSFVRGGFDSCVKLQTNAPENHAISPEKIASFCMCYARAIANSINGEEYEAMTPVMVGKSKTLPASFLSKVKAAQLICQGK